MSQTAPGDPAPAAEQRAIFTASDTIALARAESDTLALRALSRELRPRRADAGVPVFALLAWCEADEVVDAFLALLAPPDPPAPDRKIHVAANILLARQLWEGAFLIGWVAQDPDARLARVEKNAVRQFLKGVAAAGIALPEDEADALATVIDSDVKFLPDRRQIAEAVGGEGSYDVYPALSGGPHWSYSTLARHRDTDAVLSHSQAMLACKIVPSAYRAILAEAGGLLGVDVTRVRASGGSEPSPS